MIDLALVKNHLRVEHSDEDQLIQSYTDAAISAFEAWTNRILLPAGSVLPDPAENNMLITKSIEQGALMLIGYWYENRESVTTGSATEMPMATKSLWLTHKWAHL
jgi:uncharacterized phage protein (predicted DNA packaging)